MVLADLICLPPPVLLAHSATLARSPAAYAGWRWAEKTVVELGCGIAALPSLAAARNGARRVVCTDGNEDVLMATRANAQQWVREHPGVVAPLTMPLVWGDGDRACSQLRALGVEAPVDVILAADCIYVLENPGAWGKLLKTIAALSTPQTLIFITYTDRGHNKLWDRFVAERVEKLFHVVRVEKHLLHPVAESGAVGRLEQHLPPVEVFCWTLKDVSSTLHERPIAPVDPSPPSAPPSPPSSSCLSSPRSSSPDESRLSHILLDDAPLLRKHRLNRTHRTEWVFRVAESPVEQRAPSPVIPDHNIVPKPPHGARWHVEAIEGKGYGVVATSAIQAGERLLAERPLATCTKYGTLQDNRVFAKTVNALGSVDRKAFFELSQSERLYGARKTAEGVWRSNAYPLREHPDGRKEAAVYAYCCRINHACMPNVHIAWSESISMQTVHAIRPIAAGEEITVSCTLT